MKKAILTIGLFTLVLATTSFASPKSSTSLIAANTVITSNDIDGGQSTGNDRKVDYNGKKISSIDGGQSTGNDRKVDYNGGIDGGQSTGNDRKVD
ncbi:hypothetical protein [Flavobacterium sp. WC2509]|uniref:hypothetical protein n=1 Tax=Flavobacterium sp. WC2509 TaxID=3461406 RepID=UPI004043E7F2